MVIDGQRVLSFASNDYLGLANHPCVVEATMRALKKYGLGAGASHMVTGHMAPQNNRACQRRYCLVRDTPPIWVSCRHSPVVVMSSSLTNSTTPA
jgi:hypothetical protein